MNSNYLTKIKVGSSSKKVFRGETCPPELETLGRQIVESCHGLPLAIVVLGGFLANKEKTHQTWLKLIGHVNWYLDQNKSFCRDILALSYNHLSQHLKPCFLYFGIYPKDFEIPVMLQYSKLDISTICEISYEKS